MANGTLAFFYFFFFFWYASAPTIINNDWSTISETSYIEFEFFFNGDLKYSKIFKNKSFAP